MFGKMDKIEDTTHKLIKMLYKSVYIMVIVSMLGIPAYAWGNGGYSTDANNPKHGTHDLILEKALNMLPSEMRNRANIAIADYGTELPDCNIGGECIGDPAAHHVYYYTNAAVQSDTSAVRAQDQYDLAKLYLQSGDTYNFSLHLGIMSHYMSDVAVFGHTMGAYSDWGAEVHHTDYENYVENNLSSFSNIPFDGTFDDRTAYYSTLNIALDTTFDTGIYTNVWMDNNYDWSNPDYIQRTKDLINHATNNIADVTYKLLSSSRIKGDADDDGKVTITDALLYLRYSVGQNISPYNIGTSDDVTCEGMITVADALNVLRKAVGQNVNLECTP